MQVLDFILQRLCQKFRLTIAKPAPPAPLPTLPVVSAKAIGLNGPVNSCYLRALVQAITPMMNSTALETKEFMCNDKDCPCCQVVRLCDEVLACKQKEANDLFAWFAKFAKHENAPEDNIQALGRVWNRIYHQCTSYVHAACVLTPDNRWFQQLDFWECAVCSMMEKTQPINGTNFTQNRMKLDSYLPQTDVGWPDFGHSVSHVRVKPGQFTDWGELISRAFESTAYVAPTHDVLFTSGKCKEKMEHRAVGLYAVTAESRYLSVSVGAHGGRDGGGIKSLDETLEFYPVYFSAGQGSAQRVSFRVLSVIMYTNNHYIAFRRVGNTWFMLNDTSSTELADFGTVQNRIKNMGIVWHVFWEKVSV